MTTPVQDPPATSVGNPDDERTEAARQYVHRLRAFYVHSAVCAASLVLIFAVNLAVNVAAGITGEWWAWWSGWALLGCSLGLTIHGIVVRMSRPQSGTSTWEQQHVDKILAEPDAEPVR